MVENINVNGVCGNTLYLYDNIITQDFETNLWEELEQMLRQFNDSSPCPANFIWLMFKVEWAMKLLWYAVLHQCCLVIGFFSEH